MCTEEKEDTLPPVYCVLEKDRNPVGCRLSVTPHMEYLWLYYYMGVKEKYNVYKITKYHERKMSCTRNGFLFIDSKNAELYNDYFDGYMKQTQGNQVLTIEEMKWPMAIQKNIVRGRKETQ